MATRDGNMELIRQYPRRGEDLLYPMMLIAAIAVIVFSFLGIASINGWIPNSMLGSATAVATAPTVTAQQVAVSAEPAFRCAECGVIDSVREIERSGSLENAIFPKEPAGVATGI